MIYCVEDDDNIRELVIYTLETTGLKAKGFAEGAEFMEALAFDTPELILLDIMLPGEDGLAILRKLKSSSKTKDIPVIMVTAKGTEYDKVIGLDSGADDYVTKPFSLAVLRARVNNLLRRGAVPRGEVVELPPFSFDFAGMAFSRNGEAIELSKTEQRLLRLLVEHRGQTLTREQLLDRVWDGGEFVDENALSVAVRRLRAKLGDAPIKTVYGLGYTWEIQ